MKIFRLPVTLLALALPALSQSSAVREYLDRSDVQLLAKTEPKQRAFQDIQKILPFEQSQRFAEFAAARLSLGSLLESVEKLRLNKIVANTPGPAGATSLVSRVAVPAVLGFATEYGGILQTNQGTVSTLRGNLLGIARMAFGREQFPYCPEIDQKHCAPVSRWLRKVSGAISFASDRETTDHVAAATTPGASPTPVQLLGGDYRMASWGVRFDITANDPSDPKYRDRWRGAIADLRSNTQATALTEAVSELLKSATGSRIYEAWEADTINLLQKAPMDRFGQELEKQLGILVDRMQAADPMFTARVLAVRRTFANYADVRDNLLRQIQSHQFSVEYTNQHPINQPNTSNLRLIYSHQPSRSPTLITLNAATTWLHHLPAGGSGGRLRDVQAAGQLDRRLGEIPNLGSAVATFGAYCQWMKEDALIEIGPGNIAPGSGIVLPSTAATLLGTKGHIGIVQGKLTIPINSVVRVPISVTWSNRTELIKEQDLRGQIGMTIDLDSLFR